MTSAPSMILTQGRISTLDKRQPEVDTVAIAEGKVSAVGASAEILQRRDAKTAVINLNGRRVIPGLIDSHTHVIRGGLNFNLELRWEGVRSLSDAMGMLRRQVAITPPPQWVRVVGGFTEHQFAEKRLPTLEELNAVAPDTPVFILHLYDRALLNRAALRAVGYTKDTPNPPGGEIERDRRGEPTGLLLAKPNAHVLYATLARGPKLPAEYQLNSTRQFMRELNRLGVTSVIDAGGGFQNYPDDYAIIEKLERDGDLTLRFAYNLFTQKPGSELEDFERWGKLIRPGQGSDTYRMNGAGEMLVFSAADFEDFRESRPELPPTMEGELERVVRSLVAQRWPWRLHATYDESISRALDVFEKVHRDSPLTGLHWFLDHAETISERNIDRVAALGGGIAIQHRMAFQGEYFLSRYGREATERSPPIAQMLAAGLPVGAGTDATRVASYNPWVSLAWLVTGKTLGGTPLYPRSQLMEREQALRLWTESNAWFSSEVGKKGVIRVGQLADLAVLSDDYFQVPEEEISDITSVLTLLGGRIVHADSEFSHVAPPRPPAMPDWSPVHRHEARPRGRVVAQPSTSRCAVHGHGSKTQLAPAHAHDGLWGSFGCSCWAF